MGQIPGVGGGFADQARNLQAQSQAQQQQNDRSRASTGAGFQGTGVPGMNPNMDPVKVAAQIYPIMVGPKVTQKLQLANIVPHQGIPRSHRYFCLQVELTLSDC